MENSSYDNSETVSNYDEAWKYPGEAIERLTKIIIKAVGKKDRLFILDIGMGTGSLTFPLLMHLQSSEKWDSLQLNGFDISPHMNALSQQKASQCNSSSKVEINLRVHDARQGIPFDNPQKYDVIILTFLLHYLDEDNPAHNKKEWQLLIKRCSELLNEQGVIIQTEVIGDMVAVDGYPRSDSISKDQRFSSFWKEYFKERRNLQKEWNPPELRPSSYYHVFHWMMEKENNLGVEPLTGFVSSYPSILKRKQIEEWIRIGQFSSLSVGLTVENRATLIDKLNKFDQSNNDFQINTSCRFIIHQKHESKLHGQYKALINLIDYKSLHGFRALALSNEKLPINENFIDEDKDSSLTNFLESCVLPEVGWAFHDCEFILYDFIDRESSRVSWGAIPIVRPEYVNCRDNYIKGTAEGKSMIEQFYDGKGIIPPGTIIRVSVKLRCGDVDLKVIERPGAPSVDIETLKQQLESHRHLALSDVKTTHSYYITTVFATTPAANQVEPELGIGAVVLVTDQEISEEALQALQIATSEVANPIGAYYLRRDYRKQINRSARAAVFARNFSHITGSHVISNPEFRNSLAGQHLVHSLRRRLDESYTDFIRAENDLIKFITQGPNPAKNLWEQGTKALADARDKLGSGDVMLENTRRFHEYLQGRFDFIARAIDDTKDPPEPVWFVKDLLEGFLSQTAYLDNFVADVGLRLENMEFRVKIEDDEYIAQWVQPQRDGETRQDSLTPDLPFEVEWKPLEKSAEKDKQKNQASAFDRMIALPGGMVAAHAFYSLLENIIRNSVKYGKLKESDKKYILTIELGQPANLNTGAKEGSFYHIVIWDNYSSALEIDKDGKAIFKKDEKGHPDFEMFEDKYQPWLDLQKRLEKTFVKDNGQPETEDLGMMEMQACSQLLCLPDDDGKYAWPSYQKSPNGASIRPSLSIYNLRIVPPTAKIVQRNLHEQHWPLIYEFNISMPTLLGCLTGENSGRKSLTFFSNDVEELCEQAPFLLVIDWEWLKSDKAKAEARQRVESLLLKNRQALSTRILVLCRDFDNTLSSIENKFISIANDDDLFGRLIEARHNEENMILDAYRAWLRRWKPHPEDEPWDLWIGLERDASQVREAWEHADNPEIMDPETQKLVRLMVKSKDAKFSTASVSTCFVNQKRRFNSADEYWKHEYSASIPFKKALLFDNHGNCFPEAYQFEKSGSLNDSTRFYQKLSGSVSPDLFRMLSRPPKDQFSFLFFLYSLVESCLTNVAVVDERLAWSLIEGYGVNESNQDFAQDLLAHQKAGVFPVFRFRQSKNPKDQDNNVGFYTTVHADRLRDCLGLRSDNDSFLEDEGIYLVGKPDGTSGGNRIRLLTPDKSDSTDKPGAAEKAKTNKPKGYICLSGVKDENKDKDVEIDVLLIHEGAMDILASQMGVDWKSVDDQENHRKQLNALYKLAPIIIRTSGRGRKSKLLGEHLPFIEFGQVSSSLLTARNKFALVRGLLGSVGSERADGNS